jgi:HEAT repeat protein
MKVQSKNVHERSEAVEQFHRYFALFQDKNQAWLDLLKLTKDRDFNIQMKAIESIGLVSSQPYSVYKYAINTPYNSTL